MAIIPKVQDPRLNTVQCVVEGHDVFDEDVFVGARKYLVNLYWLNLIFSFIIGFEVARIVVADLEKHAKDICLLTVLHSVVELVLAITALEMAAMSERGGCPYPILYFILVFVFFIIDIANYCTFNSNSPFSKTRLKTVLTFGIFMIFHHFVWIILGIVTEPGWATIVLILYCSVLFFIYVFLYHSYKEFKEVHPFDAIFFIIILILYLGFMIGVAVAGLSFLSTDPVAGIVSSILAVIVSLLWSYFKKSFKDGPKKQTTV